MSAAPGAEAPATRTPRRRWLLVAGVVVLVVLAVVAFLLVRTGAGEPAGTAGSAASSATAPPDPAAGSSSPGTEPGTPAPVTEEPATSPVAADEAPPALPAVALDEPVAVGDVTASLVALETVDAEGVGRGSVSGPALLVTVRLANGTAEPLALDGVSVNLAHGADRVPGSPVADRRGKPFAGTVRAGGSAEARYVFSVPLEARDAVTVEVGARAGAPIAVFSGPVV